MINFNDYLENKLKNDPRLSKNFWDGYEKFKLGVILKEAQIEAGLTQNDVAKKNPYDKERYITDRKSRGRYPDINTQ